MGLHCTTPTKLRRIMATIATKKVEKTLRLQEDFEYEFYDKADFYALEQPRLKKTKGKSRRSRFSAAHAMKSCVLVTTTAGNSRIRPERTPKTTKSRNHQESERPKRKMIEKCPLCR